MFKLILNDHAKRLIVTHTQPAHGWYVAWLVERKLPTEFLGTLKAYAFNYGVRTKCVDFLTPEMVKAAWFSPVKVPFLFPVARCINGDEWCVNLKTAEVVLASHDLSWLEGSVEERIVEFIPMGVDLSGFIINAFEGQLPNDYWQVRRILENKGQWPPKISDKIDS